MKIIYSLIGLTIVTASIGLVLVVNAQPTYPYVGPIVSIGGGGSGGVTSNDVVNIINAVAPTNGGITAGQAAIQINDTNVNRIVPATQITANTTSNLLWITTLAQINASSNLLWVSSLGQINTSSNLLWGNALSQINTSSNLSWVLSLAQINATSNSIVTNLPPRGNYIALTNSTIGLPRQVALSQGRLDTNGSPVSTWTNMFPSDLEFHVLTNAFTNVVVGTIGPLTNKDGFIFWIPIGTNMP